MGQKNLPHEIMYCNGGRTGEDNHMFLEPASILCLCNGTGDWEDVSCISGMGKNLTHYASVNEAGQRFKERD
jgi:predicted NBD/HSP70 family sugar kinase